jgi:hypothetical protein
VSTLLLNHLKAKPEARDLLTELMSNMHGTTQQSGNAAQKNVPIGPESRGPLV